MHTFSTAAKDEPTLADYVAMQAEMVEKDKVSRVQKYHDVLLAIFVRVLAVWHD